MNRIGCKTIRKNGAPVRRTRAQAIKLLKTNFTVKNGCHEWNGHRTKAGYPLITFEGKTKYVHRFVLELKFGNLKKGIGALHRCDNPPCINPKHLFPGTQKDNGRDMVLKGRGRNTPFKGSKNGSSKLTEFKVAKIRKLKRAGKTERHLGVVFGVSRSAIHYVCKVGWKHIV